MNNRKYSRPWVFMSWFAPSHTIIRCVGVPVRGQHGAFSAAIGPFRTMRAAKLMAVHGAQYPTVADAERAASSRVK